MYVENVKDRSFKDMEKCSNQALEICFLCLI